MSSEATEWHPMSEIPQKSGYILLAIRHNNLNDVVMGHWSTLKGFQSNIYPASSNTFYTHWAYMPKHPEGEEWKK